MKMTVAGQGQRRPLRGARRRAARSPVGLHGASSRADRARSAGRAWSSAAAAPIRSTSASSATSIGVERALLALLARRGLRAGARVPRRRRGRRASSTSTPTPSPTSVAVRARAPTRSSSSPTCPACCATSPIRRRASRASPIAEGRRAIADGGSSGDDPEARGVVRRARAGARAIYIVAGQIEKALRMPGSVGTVRAPSLSSHRPEPFGNKSRYAMDRARDTFDALTTSHN